jgi:hypothetical protein
MDLFRKIHVNDYLVKIVILGVIGKKKTKKHDGLLRVAKLLDFKKFF